MADMTLPAALGLSNTEHRVQDALLRAFDGLDMADPELFTSAFMQDAVIDYNGTILKGFKAIVKEFYGPLSRAITTHFVTNIRTSLATKYEGSMTAKVLAQDHTLGQAVHSPPHALAGSFHRVQVQIGASGQCRIRYWKIKTIWRDERCSALVPPPSYAEAAT